MRWLKYTFIGLTSLVIAAVAMLVTLLVLLDPNHLSAGLVHIVNRTTDNQLEITGPVGVDLSLSPSVKASGIHFKNATGDFEFSAADISLQVDLLSLWTKFMIVNELLIRDGVVSARQTPDEDKVDDDKTVKLKVPFIERLDIENLAIHYLLLDETEPMEIRLESLKKDDPAGAETVVLTGAGTIDAIAFKLEGESGTAANLLETDKPFPFKYQFDVMQAAIYAEGIITRHHGPVELDIGLHIEAPDMQGLLQLLHASAPDIGSLTATGRLAGTLAAPRLDDLQVKVSKDKVTLQVSGAVGNLLRAEGIQLDFSSDVTDAELLASLLPEQSPHFNSVKTVGKLSGAGDDLLLSDYTLEASGPAGHKLELAGSTRIVKAPQPLRDLKAMLSVATPDSAFARQFNEAIPLLGPLAGSARLSLVSDVLLVDKIKLTAGDKQTLQIDARGDIKLGVTADKIMLAGLMLDLGLQAPSTTSLTTLLGTDIPALGRIQATAHVSDSGGPTAITALDVKVDKGEDLQLAVNGSLAELEKLDGIDMKLELSASDLNTIGQVFDQPLPREGAVKYSGRITGSTANLRSNGRTNLRNTTIGTSLTASFTGKRPRVAGSISIPDLDLHDIGIYPEKLAAAADTSTPREFDQVADNQAAISEDVFSREPIDFSGLNAIDLDLELTINKLSSTAASIGDVYGHVILKDGKLDIKPMRYTIENDVLDHNVMIDSTSTPPTVHFFVSGDDIDLGLLFSSSARKTSPIRGTMTARADLKSRGHSPAELASHLDGEINIIAENARIDKSVMNLVTVDVIGWAISNMLSPNADVNIDCAIIIMHFNKGIGTSDLHVIDTPDTLIKIDSQLDLVKQTMNVAIVPEHKTRLFKTKKKPMKIYGPIANPQYELVSLTDFAHEAGRAWLLAPLTISTSLLESIAGLIVKPEEPKPGSCDKFLQ